MTEERRNGPNQRWTPRALLTPLGAGATALSGCSALQGDDTETVRSPTATRTEGPTPTPTPTGLCTGLRLPDPRVASLTHANLLEIG
jgi:hypothetical protein